MSQKEIKCIKVMVYNRSDKPSASRRGNDAASRHKRPAQHLRLTAAVLPRPIAKHNEKFAVLPADQESTYVEPAERVDVDFLFAHREMRKTDGGGSISYKGRTYAPCHPEKASMARSDVEVRETLSGKI